MDGPSRRIATELRDRIDAGDLRPGDRVPSVRALVRDRGVAHATASRALDLLRRDGVIVTRPRSGSTVAWPDVEPGAPAAADTSTSPAGRHRFVALAVALADHGGLPAVTVRALAAEVGMPTMSLHRVVGGKDELVRAMIDRAFAAFPPPAGDPSTWRVGLEATARRQWAAYRRHPWLAAVVSMTRPQAIDGLLAHADHAARALERTGLDTHARLELHLVLFGYVRGMATSLAGESLAQSDTGVDADTWAAQADPLGKVLAAGRFPALARMAGGEADAYPFDLDRLFEVGLRHTLDGFAVQIRAARRRVR